MKNLVIVLVALLFFSCNQKEKNEGTISKKMGSGHITTNVDNYDVKKVNLWSSTSSSRKMIASMVNGEKVNILKVEDPYYLIESANGDGRKGYCMKEFIIVTKLQQ